MELNLAPYISVLPNVILAFLLGLLLVPLLRVIGLKFGFATKPPSKDGKRERGDDVKLHKVTISRLGEFAMVIPLLILMWRDLNLSTPQIWGITLGILIVSFIGALDSKYNFSEFVKLVALILVSIIIVFTGTIINFHSIIDLSAWDINIFNPILNSHLSLFSIIFTMFWIIVISTALSYVGGVDGLSEGTSAVAIMILTLIGIRNNDILTITIGSLCFGGLLGLLPYNFYPKMIMSEHLIYGFVIAILSIISGGKVAMSILLLIVPLVDFMFVLSDRTYRYFKTNGVKFNLIEYLHALGTPEKNHLHHKLLNLGLNHAQISFIQYIIYAFFGTLAIISVGMYLTLIIFLSIAFLLVMYYYLHIRINRNVEER